MERYSRSMVSTKVPLVPLCLVFLVSSVQGNQNYHYYPQQQNQHQPYQQGSGQGAPYYPQQPSLQHPLPPPGSQPPGAIAGAIPPNIPGHGAQQPMNGMLSTQLGAVENIDSTFLTSNNLECSRCGNSRLIGCMKRKCYYRCYRRCHDGNGTSWDEAIRFILPGV